VELRGLSFYFC